MSPGLNDGDYVVTKRARKFIPGFIYVVNHIDLGRIIKRLKAFENQRLILSGDNQNSTPDSLIAPTTPDRVIGQVVLVISKSGISRPPRSSQYF